MIATLSTKGQIVLPKQARARLQLRPGARLQCRIDRGSIVLTPESGSMERPQLVRDAKTDLMVTKSPAHVIVTTADVRAALADFP
ncbi:MAG TPA: AbrB family transcriptional regulator [Verrucomicrobiales bacterium]|nr:AbrB family transcriptional regulator [Verrucomicrobiales bacterium]